MFLFQILRHAKALLLQCATPEAVITVTKTNMPLDEATDITNVYFEEQKHDNLLDILQKQLMSSTNEMHFLQVCVTQQKSEILMPVCNDHIRKEVYYTVMFF